MSPQTEWTLNDGWILMAVYLMHGQDGSSLPDLLAAADAMNHAIPTTQELTGALTRLARCGVVRRVKDRFQITPGYLPAVSAASDNGKGLFDQPDQGQKWLAATQFDIDARIRITITQDAVTKAVEAYLARLKRK